MGKMPAFGSVKPMLAADSGVRRLRNVPRRREPGSFAERVAEQVQDTQEITNAFNAMRADGMKPSEIFEALARLAREVGQ